MTSLPRLFAVVALALAMPAAAIAKGPVKAVPAGSLQRAIDQIADRPAFRAAFWGIEVRSLRSGKLIYARNAEKSLTPASTLKLVTTAAVLDAVGPQERIKTTVETTARLDGMGRVLGDVYLVGRGDPNLSGRFAEGRVTAAFEEMVEGLQKAGVKRIEGGLIGHEGLFQGERRGEDWGWGDLVWWYGAEVSALAVNDSAVDLRVVAGERVGDPAVVDASPRSSYYSVVAAVTTGPAGSESTLTLTKAPGANLIRLSGSYPLGKEPWENSVALEDPARYATTLFAELLEARGIRVTGGVATTSEPLPPGLRTLAFHESPPLTEMIKAVNKSSQNLHAEMLLRLLGARVKGAGTSEAGHQAVADFLRRMEVTAGAWALQDGSGLSRSNLLTPHELVNLLLAMDRHPQARAFRDSLPTAGVDGTLKNRMKGTPAAGRVQAKTGTLRQVTALAGYATSRSGEPLVFSMVLNHDTSGGREAVAAIDAICNLLAGK